MMSFAMTLASCQSVASQLPVVTVVPEANYYDSES